jgi:hypothetical protein
MQNNCPDSVYPKTRTVVHDNKRPEENAWCVRDGRPINVPYRDIRFPLVWEVDSHPLTHGDHKSWVIILDTSKEARHQRSLFQAELTTPLGPQRYMDHFGNFFCFLLIFLLICCRSDSDQGWDCCICTSTGWPSGRRGIQDG